MPDTSLLIVAHPDDEVLWFSSILRQVSKVIIAFKDYDAAPGLGVRRAAAMAELPYATLVCLDIAEAGSFKRANWDDPKPTRFGLALDEGVPGSEPRRRYERNFGILRRELAAELRPGLDVFTHNPWGEYGHEDHVQLYRVIESLHAEIGFRMWTSSYCSARAAALAVRFRPAGRTDKRLTIDPAYAEGIGEIYRRHDCWTWHADWRWPAEESFLPGPLEHAQTPRSAPDARLQFVPSDVPPSVAP